MGLEAPRVYTGLVTPIRTGRKLSFMPQATVMNSCLAWCRLQLGQVLCSETYVRTSVVVFEKEHRKERPPLNRNPRKT